MEAAFVAWLRAQRRSDSDVPIHVGDDDAALWRHGSAEGSVLTADLIADGTHFQWERHAPELVGRKAMAVNLSDMAAMAAEPRVALVTILFPDSMTLEAAQALYRGMDEMAKEFGVTIVGGDTNSWSGKLVVSVTLLGTPTSRGVLRRQTAKVGDAIVVTGPLGGSLAGHHLHFTPRVREALALHHSLTIHSGMDITDGLALDLSRLTEASGVGAELWLDQIPISPAAREASRHSGRTALDHALSDGEDFELLLTLPPEELSREDAIAACGVPLIRVGTVIETLGLWQRTSEGALERLAPRGYLHGAAASADSKSPGTVSAGSESPGSESPAVASSIREIRFEAGDERGTGRLGEALAATLPDGAVVSLQGTLGAGKTRLVQSVAQACGVPVEDVLSPTFTLCNQYAGQRTIHHWDLYRVRDDDELYELGLEESCEAAELTFVEWADRFPHALPEDRLEIVIQVAGETSRSFTVRGDERVLRALADCWQASAAD